MIVVAVVASGVMWFLSTGVNHVWPLAWLAPIPLLVVIPDLSLRHAASAAFAGSALGALNFVIAYLRLPVTISAGGVIFIALEFTAVALAWRGVARRRSPALAVIAFGALTASVEYFGSLPSPHGTFGSLAYSQADVPVILQLASVTGLWGITFIVAVVPAAFAMAWRTRRDRRAVVLCAACAAVPLVLALGFGIVRLAAAPPNRVMSIGLVAIDAAVRHFDDTDAADALPLIRRYAAQSAGLAGRGAQIVVLPEKFVGVTPAYADQARAVLADVARERRVMIVAGLNLVGQAPARNVAAVFDPAGRAVLEYDKQHLVPGLEGAYRPGAAVGLVPGPYAGLGVAICKDLDFSALGRDYARAGVGLLLVPAWDFVTDGWVHSRMAILRGVEGGFALARAASQGRLTVSDARGRLIAERVSDDRSDVVVAANVAIAPGGTLYSRSGDWFAWLCAAIAAACLLAPRRAP